MEVYGCYVYSNTSMKGTPTTDMATSRWPHPGDNYYHIKSNINLFISYLYINKHD